MSWLITDGNLITSGKIGTDMSGDLTSSAIDIKGLYAFSLQVAWSGGSLNGNIKLQASNDGTNWSDVSDSQQSISSGTVSGGFNYFMWNVMSAMFRYVRFKWTRTSGSGTLTACQIVGKG